MTVRKLREAAVSVDHCGRCGGIWFQKGELERASPDAARDLRAPRGATKADLLCPECLVLLRKFVYPQTYVEVDFCPRCRGLWLDHNEFQEVRAVRGHLKRSGKLEPDPVPGLKGTLISFINRAIDELDTLNLDS